MKHFLKVGCRVSYRLYFKIYFVGHGHVSTTFYIDFFHGLNRERLN